MSLSTTYSSPSTSKRHKGFVCAMLAGLVVGSVVLFAGCGSSNSSTTSSNDSAADSSTNTISVVATINQWGSLAQELAGDNADVSSIMSNTNVEAHDYEPTSQDVAALEKADIVIINGADYDHWAESAVENVDATVIDVAQLAGIEEGENPHIWFSSSVRAIAADAITHALQEADADNASSYEALNTAWQQTQKNLEDAIANAKETTDGIAYAATESVAYYLAQDLGMQDVTPEGYAQAAENESDPSPSDLKQFQDMLTDGTIAVLIYNSQESDATTDELLSIAEEHDVKVVELTEQMPSEFTTLTDWMQSLVHEFAS